ncbi:YqeG family HAD IIIA-type phosphatase [Synechococcus sp. Nb3U1]|uniref:YqeG family HAD IIIA-type phosphatase n=1 Tax=Synechococcus sp. Nb3U1 TaxID=1914529 RepID=UPI001F39A908|nr:YqeG family HAD IIIA-type phosphatase [Synechococcus sp. Nb3U1]MCF2969720.1 YqeG family HAD IIIA-type phosphatase [Synechococcus sp. Nb3U1]
MVHKPWFKLLQPDLVVAGTVLRLQPEALLEWRVRGIIFDVDGTLLPIQQAEVDPAVVAWLEQLRPQFQIWLVSNNINRNRIRQIGESLDLPHIHRAGKPSRRALRRAVTQMGLPVEAVAMVGDRLLTDILAGNRLGLVTVLVNSLLAGVVEEKPAAILDPRS